MTSPVATSRAAIGMGAIAAVSRAIGFVRVLVIAAVLGTTYLGNAFQSANSFSNVLFELLAAGALSAVLVPTFVSLLEAGDQRRAEEVAGGVLGVALVALGLVAAIGIVFAPALAELLTLGVPDAVATDQRELVTFLVRCFLPQILLYAAGAIAIAALHAQRRFAVTSAAPIGNTLVMVTALVAFRIAAGGAPGLDLSDGERWLLAFAGTGGVVAFVGSLLVALSRTGFRLRPRLIRGDEGVREVLIHSGWGTVLHTGAGLLLGASIVAGSAVEGGVVAYQVAFVFFLAPYAILAQPIHTAILPELVSEVQAGDDHAFATSVRWALERMALLALPVSALMAALALPAMRTVTFGAASEGGPELLAAALSMLALGLFPYGAFLLLARVSYARGDSRTPGLVALATAGVGAMVMALGAMTADGWARVAVIGAGHSAAYLCGSVVLFTHLRGRVGAPIWPPGLGRLAMLSAAVGMGVWLVSREVLGSDPARWIDASVGAGLAVAGVLVAAGAARVLGLTASLTKRLAPAAGDPEVFP